MYTTFRTSPGFRLDQTGGSTSTGRVLSTIEMDEVGALTICGSLRIDLIRFSTDSTNKELKLYADSLQCMSTYCLFRRTGKDVWDFLESKQ